jgi:hypothetical protein
MLTRAPTGFVRRTFTEDRADFRAGEGRDVGNAVDVDVFDVIFSERSLQGFLPAALARGIPALDARLAESGEGHALVQNSETALERIESVFRSLGFSALRYGDAPPLGARRVLYMGLGSG